MTVFPQIPHSNFGFKNQTSKQEYVAFFLVIIAVLIRFLIGLQSPDSLAIAPGYVHSDLAISGLMAKHVLDTGEFPFFFWGQNWFGGLEAFLHGVVFSVLGISAWAMRITTILLFGLFCMLTFLIARELHNDSVGVIATLWCVVAPMTLTCFSLVPQTHYIETPVLGSLLIWLSILLAKSTTKFKRGWLYFILGVMGGFGWWTSPLIIYYLIAITFYMLLKERIRAIYLGISLTLPGFILGALPFFIYYARDPYSSIMGMGQGFDWIRLAFGLKRFFLEVGPWILDIFLYQPLGFWAVCLIVCFYVYVLIFYGIYGEGKNFLKLILFRNNTNASGILTILFLSTAFVYGSSLHATRFKPHYVISLVSLVPIAVGYAIWQVQQKWRFFTIPIFILYLGAQSFFIVEWAIKDVPTYEKSAQQILDLINFLKSNGLTRIYANYFTGSKVFSFMSGESVICSDAMQERYRPYELMLDAADQPAFVTHDAGALDSVLKAVGGSCHKDIVHNYHIYHDFVEPKRQYKQINHIAIKGKASQQSESMKNVLDRDANTVWNSGGPRAQGMWVEFDLGKEYSLGMIRLWNTTQDHQYYAMDVSVKISQDGKKWHDVIPRMKTDYYYWSGPRPYYWEASYRWEVRFGPVSARYIRIKQYENSKSKWKIAEAYIYEDVGQRASKDTQDYQRIIEQIRKLKLKNVYADRWMSAKIREATHDQVKTIEPFTNAKKDYYLRMPSRMVCWDPDIGFVCEDSDSEVFEKTIHSAEITLIRADYGRWSLFYLDQWSSQKDRLNMLQWWWMGLGVVNSNVDLKLDSERLWRLGDESLTNNNLEEAVLYFKAALKSYPNHQLALRRLIETLKKLGNISESEQCLSLLKAQTEVQHSTPVLFENGVELLGYSIDSEKNIRPGQSLNITYYWKLHQEPKSDVAVFVHISGSGNLFQGDHNWLEHQQNIWPVLNDEIFSEETVLNIPEHIPSGVYEIGLGLFNPITGKRLKVKKTSLACSSQKITIGILKIFGK